MAFKNIVTSFLRRLNPVQPIVLVRYLYTIIFCDIHKNRIAFTLNCLLKLQLLQRNLYE
jgi:hypothetical protein